MVIDEDDQDPSFNYQGCTVQDGACINPEYYTTVSNHYHYLQIVSPCLYIIQQQNVQNIFCFINQNDQPNVLT